MSKKTIILSFLVVLGFSAYGQGYVRDLKITNPRMNGKDVMSVQSALMDMGYKIGTLDGWYGPKTEEAVKAYQSFLGFNPNGIVAKKEWDSIKSNDALIGRIQKDILAINTSFDLKGYTKSESATDYVTTTIYRDKGSVRYAEIMIGVEDMNIEYFVYHIQNRYLICNHTLSYRPGDPKDSYQAFYVGDGFAYKILNGDAQEMIKEELDIWQYME